MAATNLGARLFRNNTGTGWVGKTTSVTRAGNYYCEAGDKIVRDARPLDAGLCKGSADLIGWMSIEITPEMVGQRIAVFTAIEAKTGRTRTSTEQANFIQQVQKAGGNAGILRDNTDGIDEIITV